VTSDELFTRCPTCRTVYRTSDEQLSVQSGKVRCGHCRMVFDGRTHLVELAPEPEPEPDEAPPAPAQPIAEETISPEGLDAGATARVEPPGTRVALDEHAGAETEESPPVEAAAVSPTAVPEVEGEHADGRDEGVVPYQWQDPPAKHGSRGVRWALGAAAVLLAILLAGQALFQFRNVIAAGHPQYRPNLVAACAAIGCTIDPVRGRDEITIESHDLEADPAHQGLLILQIVLRNRASHAVAFPHLELEILDLDGQPQVRRAFAPVEYAGGAADFARGMPAGAEWNVKLFLDASSVQARGYNLDLFYP
jgi:predicted Zn finger-like uncharacterized protein